MEAKSFPLLKKYRLSNSNFLFGMVGLLGAMPLFSFTILFTLLNSLKFKDYEKINDGASVAHELQFLRKNQ
jgi:hypothetical protein